MEGTSVIKGDNSVDTPRDEASPESLSSQRSTPPSNLSMPNAKPMESTRPEHHNRVSTVMLTGVPIVSLFIDGKERLCLAQISNTLLKAYSYNEIHNRRVALGITCVQCTPVQLEILRRAGAMPVSSRRCGMITKREAERLVKSFLEDNSPPKLPEDFSFDVHHECGWGCRGNFEPSRYNSSRAKCIKCAFCNMFFSPNKFIFHFHRSPEAKYSHPDAANFNSWRRHLKLVQTDKDDIAFLWEDVKAMFNGGSRKRILANFNSRARTEPSSGEAKKPKIATDNAYISKNFPSQYPSYGLFSPPGKPYPFGSVPAPHSFGFGFPHTKDSVSDSSKPMMSPSPWGTQNNLSFPTYDLFWANTLALSRSGNMRNGFYSGIANKQQNLSDSLSGKSSNNSGRKSSKPESVGTGSKNGLDRLSAFRPVGRNTQMREDDMPDKESLDSVYKTDDEENEEIDVTEDTVDEKIDQFMSDEDNAEDAEVEAEAEINSVESVPVSPEVKEDEIPDIPNQNDGEKDSTKAVSQENENVKGSRGQVTDGESSPEAIMADSGMSDQSDSEIDTRDLITLTKEELCKQLKSETEARKRIEREVGVMKETYQEQSSRDKTYREEMAHQLQVVRDTLTSELEQERKARFSLQQKLKEAHDALHSFSCKMLASRHCEECSYKDSAMPR